MNRGHIIGHPLDDLAGAGRSEEADRLQLQVTEQPLPQIGHNMLGHERIEMALQHAEHPACDRQPDEQRGTGQQQRHILVRDGDVDNALHDERRQQADNGAGERQKTIQKSRNRYGRNKAPIRLKDTSFTETRGCPFASRMGTERLPQPWYIQIPLIIRLLSPFTPIYVLPYTVTIVVL